MVKVSNWEKRKGVEFLKRVKIKKDDKILDFGCNTGNYSIPASILTGDNGVVFAVDKDDAVLRTVAEKAELMYLANIKTMNMNEELKFDFADDFFDVVMLYDILHYFNIEERKLLYHEILRILKTESILSVYPKHVIGNFTLMELRNVNLKELKNEIEMAGFEFSSKVCGKLSHDNYLEEGCVINFIAE